MNAKLTTVAVIIISIFLSILNFTLFNESYFHHVSIIITFLACLPFIISHGKGRVFFSELKLLVILTTLSLIAFTIFRTVSFFRPLIAITLATGMYFGTSAGYICGVFTVFISSYAFVGIGEWTPFQVILLGAVGATSALFNKTFLRNNTALIIFSFLSSILFSFSNNIQTLWLEKNKVDYVFPKSLLLSSLKWALIYAISDVAIVLLFKFIIGNKFKRLKERFKIFE